jgi:hypothetical protein
MSADSFVDGFVNSVNKSPRRQPAGDNEESLTSLSERAVALKNPYHENGADLSRDDIFTLAGITIGAPRHRQAYAGRYRRVWHEHPA